MSSTDARDDLAILFQDDHLLVLNKPSGIPVQDDQSGDTSLMAIVKDRLPKGPVGLVHRLDRPVSGAVLMTLSREAEKAMHEAFRDGRVDKRYLAVVHGRPVDHFVLEHRLVHDKRRHRARIGSGDEGRLVRLHGRVVRTGERYSLVELVPEEGAFHQIRAQLAAAGHPIKGDVKYGARRGERDRSIALHASWLRFDHPVAGLPIEVVVPPPISGIWSLFGPIGRIEGQGRSDYRNGRQRG
ncbi:MAG: RluA family pseudouridine synthase [Flavobacteriales bacterium]|nr:RluA family pseudouridine synthase [Flavobacteriales bacterium]